MKTPESDQKNNIPANTLTYRDAGVDIDAGEQLVKNIKPLAKKTNRPGLLGGLGGFGALFEIPKTFKNPVLEKSRTSAALIVSCTTGTLCTRMPAACAA